MNKFEANLGTYVVKYRWWIIVATILTVASAAGGMRLLTFNNDLRIFFSEKNPQLQALQALENTYNKIDNILFVIAPKDSNVFTRETLIAVEALTEASWQIPYSSRVDSITNFQHTRAQGDDLIVEDLVRNAENLTSADLERIRQIALNEPLLVNRRLSSSGHVTGVNVTVLMPGKSVEEVPAVVAFARKLADDFRETQPDIDLYLTGAVMFDNGFAEVSRDDMVVLTPIMFLVLIVITGLSLRSFTGTVATLSIVLVSMGTGMGLAGWLGMPLTPASASAPTIILTLAVADSVHILVTVLQQMRLGKSKHGAIAESLRVNLQAVFLTSTTTAIGFLTMNFSDAPPFRDLGNIVAIGVIAAFVYSVLFLPALLAVLPMRVRPKPARAHFSICDSLAHFVTSRQTVVFWSSLILITIMAAGTLRIELGDDWVKYFDERYDLRRATDFMSENLTGFDIIEYSLESGESGGINNPEYLAKIEEFSSWYRQRPEVVHVYTFTDIMKRLNKNMHGDDESYYRIPEQRDLAAQYLLLYELSLPFGLDLNNQINVDKSATRMIVTLRGTTTRELREIDENARTWLRANAPESMFTHGSGLSIIWAHLSRRNINHMLGASFGALVLISLILIFALRSVRLGLVSLMPNLAPACMAFGVWGLLVGQVGLGLSVIVSLTLGIVVDDTVHFLSHYLRARREQAMIPASAVRYSFNTVGTAMWVTTVVLVAGFLVLTFSGFKMTAEMGLMSAITITLALAMDFLFLPTLLVKLDRKAGQGVTRPKHGLSASPMHNKAVQAISESRMMKA
jgi:predicted RND superfamily exporter protein